MAVPIMRVLIADDHTLFRRGLALLLRTQYSDVSIVEAGDSDEALRTIDAGPAPDLVLCDLAMPGMTRLAESVGFKHVRVTDERLDQNFFWSEAYRRGKIRHGSRLEEIFSAAELEQIRQSAAAAAARGESCHGIFVLHKH